MGAWRRQRISGSSDFGTHKMLTRHAGLVPGIYALLCCSRQDVDARVKPAHDE